MRKLIGLVAVLAALTAQASAPEVLVLTTPTLMVAPSAVNYRRVVEIQNLGPNPIYCALRTSTDAVVNKARRIDTYGSWAIDTASVPTSVYCVCSVNQVTGAASIVTEQK